MKPITTQNFNEILKNLKTSKQKLSPVMRESPEKRNNEL